MRKRIVVGALIALTVIVALWVWLAHGGGSPIATPDQMFYLKRKLAHTQRLVISYPLSEDPDHIITDKARIREFVDALVIRRMVELMPGGRPYVTLAFYIDDRDPFLVDVAEGPERLLYGNPWRLDAEIPPRLRRLLELPPPVPEPPSPRHVNPYPRWPPPGMRQ
jgi:hypothetical protein